MALPFKRVTLHFRELALLREIYKFAVDNGFWDKRFQYADRLNSRILAEKLLHRLNKHFKKLLEQKSKDGCTGCGASPYREYLKS